MNKFKPGKKAQNNEKVVVSIRIDNETLNKIDNLANKVDISRNELINQCIKFSFDHLEFDENKKDMS